MCSISVNSNACLHESIKKIPEWTRWCGTPLYRVYLSTCMCCGGVSGFIIWLVVLVVFWVADYPPSLFLISWVQSRIKLFIICIDSIYIYIYICVCVCYILLLDYLSFMFNSPIALIGYFGLPSPPDAILMIFNWSLSTHKRFNQDNKVSTSMQEWQRRRFHRRIYAKRLLKCISAAS